MARFRLELGPVPLHHQVYLDLRRRSTHGEWRPGDRLPAGARARRALRLQPDHRPPRARRARPRGAARADPRPRHDRPRRRGSSATSPATLSFTEEMQTRGLDPETRLIAARPESAGEVGRGRARDRAGSPTLYLERLRLADGEPLLLEQVHLPAERFPGLLASDLEHGSLYDLLTERYGTRIARAREALEPVLLRAREARLLGRKPRRRRPCSSRASPSPPTARRSSSAGRYVRGDRTRYYVERVVVRPRWHRAPADDAGGGRTSMRPRAGRPAARHATEERRRDDGSSDSPPSSRSSRSWPPSACGASASARRRHRRPPAAATVSGDRPPPPSGGPRATPAPDRRSADGSRLPSPATSSIRWYCCLGAGDAPEQVAGREEGRRRRSTRRTPNIHLKFEAMPYAGARDTLLDPDRLRQRPGHRRPGRHRRRQRLRRPVARPRAATSPRPTTT